MTPSAERILAIYDGTLADRYDRPISHIFESIKRRAYEASGLGPGQRVLVLCCGTGLDFTHILERIGPSGNIVGVDFSFKMLAQARLRVESEGWANVDLVQADVTGLDGRFVAEFDAAVCTLGMSVIPDYPAAYQVMLDALRPGGELMIGDMQLASGAWALLNPLTVAMARRYGGSTEGHRNCVQLADRMERDLTHLRRRELFFRSYFFAIGRTPGEVVPTATPSQSSTSPLTS